MTRALEAVSIYSSPDPQFREFGVVDYVSTLGSPGPLHPPSSYVIGFGRGNGIRKRTGVSKPLPFLRKRTSDWRKYKVWSSLQPP